MSMKMQGCIRMEVQAGYIEDVVITIGMHIILMILQLIALHTHQFT